MFHTWLKNNTIEAYDFSSPLMPKASDRAFWECRGRDCYIKNGEQFLDYAWPISKATDFMAFKAEGNRARQETPSFQRREALYSLFLAEISEFKKRFLPDIVNGIFAICEEIFWGISAHMDPVLYAFGKGSLLNLPPDIPNVQMDNIDLFAAETASMLSIIYYMLYDELYEFCPEILKWIEYEMERRIIKPYLKHYDFWWMGYFRDVNNWNPWILSNLETVFLLVEKNRTIQIEGLRKMLYEIQRIYDHYPEDGGCDEGAFYWTLSGGRLFDFCNQLYIATDGKINFFEDEKIKKIARYEYMVSIGNGYVVNFSDGEAKIDSTVGSVLYCFGERIAEKSVSYMGKSMWEHSQKKGEIKLKGAEELKYHLYGMMFLNGDTKTSIVIHENTENGACVLEHLQQAFVRDKNWYYAAKGGRNDESHNHNDVGSFLVYYDNMPVLVDPGCGTYTAATFNGKTRYNIWTMQSSWHNLPEINGEMQKDGGVYAADKFLNSDKNTSIRFAGAYPKEAKVKEVKRFLDMKEGIELTDQFVFEQSDNEICENFITPLSVRAEENSIVIGEKFIMTVFAKEGEEQKTVQITFDEVRFDDDEKLIRNWDALAMNRIRLVVSAENTVDVHVSLKRYQ